VSTPCAVLVAQQLGHRLEFLYLGEPSEAECRVVGEVLGGRGSARYPFEGAPIIGRASDHIGLKEADDLALALERGHEAVERGLARQQGTHVVERVRGREGVHLLRRTRRQPRVEVDDEDVLLVQPLGELHGVVLKEAV